MAVLIVLCGGSFALAAFTAEAHSDGPTVGTASLSPPKSLSAAQLSCQRNGSVEIELTWSASGSAYASSYTVERSNASNGSYVKLASVPLGTTSYTDTGSSLASSSTYYYRVSVVYMSWSASASTSVGTLNKQCH